MVMRWIERLTWCREAEAIPLRNGGLLGANRRTISVSRLPRVFGVAAMAVFASACGGGGGGGGGGGSTNTVSTPPSPVNFTARAEHYRNDPEFSNQWGLGEIRANQAYARVEIAYGLGARPGEGVTIGIVDSGIDQDHPAFAGSAGSRKKILVEQFLPGARDEPGPGFDFSHGTAVAGVAAGNRGTGLPGSAHGVAEGANLAIFAAPLSGALPGIYRPTNLVAMRPAEKQGIENWFSTPLEWGRANGGIDILNLSFAYFGLIENYGEAELRAQLGQLIETMAQRQASEKTILVWAAGNHNGQECLPGSSGSECRQDTPGRGRVDATSVSLLAGLQTYIEELRGHVLAVVSVGENGEIFSTSNRCGIAANWCLAAPGENVVAAHFGSGGVRNFERFRGTSFAAPMVSGGLALMKQIFRNQLSNTALVARLLATANSRGMYANRSIYGQGLMDLGAATSPAGQMTLASGGRVGDPGFNLQVSGIALGDALGDGLTQSLMGKEIAAFDSLGAPFWFDLGHFAVAEEQLSMKRRLRDFMSLARMPREGIFGPDLAETGFHRFRVGLLETPRGAENGHLALARYANTLTMTDKSGWSATAFSTEGISGQAPIRGVTLSWRPTEVPLGLRTGWLIEREGLLGSSARGSFGGWSSDSGFIGIEMDGVLDGWQLGADFEMGIASAEPRGGLITDVSLLTTSAFTFHATRPLSSDQSLWFSISQPLRAESGHATLSVPIGRTKGGEVLRESLMADLAPTGRQIDVAAHWNQSLSLAGELRLGAIWTHQPGHRAAADSDFSLLAALRFAFP